MKIKDVAYTMFAIIGRIPLSVQACVYCMFGSLIIYAMICYGLINWANHLPPHPCETSVTDACADTSVDPPSDVAHSHRHQLAVSK